MKTATCIERLYRIKENNETKYYIRLKRELSDNLMTNLLHEDMEVKTFIGACDIILPSDYESEFEEIETIKIPVERQSDVDRVKEFITDRLKENKDFSNPEIARALNIPSRRAKDIVQLLKKHAVIKRSNPEVKEKRLFRWIKSPEGVEVETPVEIETETPRLTIEEQVLKVKDAIRDFYKEGKDFNAQELFNSMTGIEKKELSYILYKLHRKEHYIKIVNPRENRNRARYIKAEAMIAPEHVEDRNLNKLLEERKMVIDQLG